MPKASVKRLIESKKKKLIDFVLDIEKYPEFIPFCLDSKVYLRREKNDFILIIADLTIGKGILKDTYKSDVKFNKKEDTILVTNIDGPLKYLENKWKFIEKDNLTEVSFDVDFELFVVCCCSCVHLRSMQPFFFVPDPPFNFLSRQYLHFSQHFDLL